MLILTRKIGEAIRIGDSIVVRLMEIERNSVRIGIEAPPEMRIFREEIFQRVDQQNRESAQWDLDALAAAHNALDILGTERKA